ncbi:hypothetical protein LSTR_LSTR007322 [Laodelphax striatellus]|uniref:Uncharacterized protein n=1 Tax=Laodelphax striatellus TaxID=195883 RepID=A0A482WSM9_LAOST|nr:hypothetical protein LSTR_LSTR007322 [Laodelphax striatellus]
MEFDSSENNKVNTDSLFCFVDGCFTTSARNKNLGFHQFPPNDEKRILRKYKNGTQKLVNTRQLWIEALNIEREGTTVIGKMRVCSLHFSRNDFNIQDVKKPFAYLKRTAIPRRNLPLRKNSKLTTRLQVRGFNRLKWRGRLAFQDLDVRVPVSRNRPMKKTEQKESTKETPQNEGGRGEGEEAERIEEEEEEECMQVEGFTVSSLEDGMEKAIGLDGECAVTDKEQITSEFIIKEEPLSDNEQEMEDWSEENNTAGVERNENYNEGEPVWIAPTTVDDKVTQRQSTTQSVLDDLESSADETDLERREKKKEEEEEKDAEEEKEEEEETSVRDRPCKSCGKRDCSGHDVGLSPSAFVCVVCNELFHTSAQLDAHSEKHDEELNMYGNSWHDDFVYRNSKDLECKICGKHFATKTVLKEHVSRHVGDKLLVCVLCGRQFRHKINLVVHVNAHTIVRHFSCAQCPMVFGMRVDLEDHRRMHAEHHFKCQLCGAGFASQRALWTHKQVHTRRMASKKKKGSNSTNSFGRNGYNIKRSSYPCRVCSKVLSTKNTLREHMMIHSGEKPHECMLCGKLIRHKANFILHVQSHSQRRHLPPSHFCHLCETDFATKAELSRHQAEMHYQASSSSPTRCMLCGDSFRGEQALRQHVEEVHGDEGNRSQEDEEEEEEYGELFRPHLLDGFAGGVYREKVEQE